MSCPKSRALIRGHVVHQCFGNEPTECVIEIMGNVTSADEEKEDVA